MIFISYASEDAAVADRIRPVRRRWASHAGSPRAISSRAPASRCDHGSHPVVQRAGAAAHRAGQASRHVLSEVELAFNAGKPILAVLIGKHHAVARSDISSPLRTGLDADVTFDDADLAS